MPHRSAWALARAGAEVIGHQRNVVAELLAGLYERVLQGVWPRLPFLLRPEQLDPLGRVRLEPVELVLGIVQQKADHLQLVVGLARRVGVFLVDRPDLRAGYLAHVLVAVLLAQLFDHGVVFLARAGFL
ncbi:MAG: hypothetical protein R8G60_17565 [Roseovarius pacificus]|nr:hypothetical protein [Roseovarius pacificus]